MYTHARTHTHSLIHTYALAQVDLHCGAHECTEWNDNDPVGFNLNGWSSHPRMKVRIMLDLGPNPNP